MKLDSKELTIAEIKRLNDRIRELESEVQDMTRVIVENGLEDEIGLKKTISVEEKICIDGINHLAKLFELGSFTKDDAQMLDILHKNLRMVRNQSIPKENGKGKKKDVAELLSIVKGK